MLVRRLTGRRVAGFAAGIILPVEGQFDGQATAVTHGRLHLRHHPHRPPPRQSRLRPQPHKSHDPRLLQCPRRRRYGCVGSGLGHQADSACLGARAAVTLSNTTICRFCGYVSRNRIDRWAVLTGMPRSLWSGVYASCASCSLMRSRASSASQASSTVRRAQLLKCPWLLLVLLPLRRYRTHVQTPRLVPAFTPLGSPYAPLAIQ